MQKLTIPLELNPENARRLSALQIRFSQCCRATLDIATAKGVFGRVALHHEAYKPIRTLFAELGAQLVSNSIYVVSASYKRIGGALEASHFDESLPVVLDRRTVSIQSGRLSIFTMEGRLRLHIAVSPEVESIFRGSDLKEIQLRREASNDFSLHFFLKSEHGPS